MMASMLLESNHTFGISKWVISFDQELDDKIRFIVWETEFCAARFHFSMAKRTASPVDSNWGRIDPLRRREAAHRTIDRFVFWHF